MARFSFPALGLFFAHVLPTLYAMPAKQSAAACSLGRRPVNGALFGNEISSLGECDRATGNLWYTLRLERWAIVFSSIWTHNLFSETDTPNRISEVCPLEIVAVFRRSNQPAVIWYRLAVVRSFFSHEEQQLAQKTYKRPCDKVPFRKFFAWGLGRTRFIEHIKAMYTGIEKLRTNHCYEDVYHHKVSWSTIEVEDRTHHERVTSTAQVYLDSVAFNSFLCI